MGSLSLWCPGFSVRNARVDEQHIELMAMSDELLAWLGRTQVPDHDLAHLLEEIASLNASHARLEGELLTRNQCPTLTLHQRLAAQGDADLQGWVAQARSGQLDRSALAVFMGAWMVNHLIETDLPVRDYLRE